jgi:hypothetical protein
LRKLGRGGHQVCRSTPKHREVTTQLRLEHLEERLTPTTFNTTTNAAVSISPNFFARTANETITATVTQGGTNALVTSGNVAFNINGQTGDSGAQQRRAGKLHDYAALVRRRQQPDAAGFLRGCNCRLRHFQQQRFSLAHISHNILNALFPSNITFVGPPTSQSSLPINPYGSFNGETNSVLLVFVPVDFHYVNPGTIQTFDLFGITFSGYFSAAVFAPYEFFYNSLNIQLLWRGCFKLRPASALSSRTPVRLWFLAAMKTGPMPNRSRPEGDTRRGIHRMTAAAAELSGRP